MPIDDRITSTQYGYPAYERYQKPKRKPDCLTIFIILLILIVLIPALAAWVLLVNP